MADAYLRQRQINHDISGTLVVVAATTTTTLVTAKAAHTVFIQRIIFAVTTDAAQSLTFQDSAGTPVVLEVVPASPGVNTRWDFDFGSRGVPLTEAKNFVASFSAAGLAGILNWEGYMRLTGALNVNS